MTTNIIVLIIIICFIQRIAVEQSPTTSDTITASVQSISTVTASSINNRSSGTVIDSGRYNSIISKVSRSGGYNSSIDTVTHSSGNNNSNGTLIDSGGNSRSIGTVTDSDKNNSSIETVTGSGRNNSSIGKVVVSHRNKTSIGTDTDSGTKNSSNGTATDSSTNNSKNGTATDYGTNKSNISRVTNALEKSPTLAGTTAALEQSPATVETTAALEQSPASVERTAVSEQSPAPVVPTAASEQSPAPVETTAASAKSPAPVETTAASEQSPAPVETTAASKQSLAPVKTTAASEQSPAPVEPKAASEQSPAPVETIAASEQSPAPVERTAASEQSPAPVERTVASVQSPAPVETTAASEQSPAPVETTAALEQSPAPAERIAASTESLTTTETNQTLTFAPTTHESSQLLVSTTKMALSPVTQSLEGTEAPTEVATDKTTNQSTVALSRKTDCYRPDLTNAELLETGNLSTTYNSTLGMKCKIGYEIKKANMSVFEAYITCDENGQWKGTMSCTIKDCQEPLLTHASLFETENHSTTYDSTLGLKCETGYEIMNMNNMSVNNANITCDENGQWVGTRSCTIKDCGVPFSPKNGKVDTENGTVYQSLATYSCIMGYTLHGDNSTVCDSSGNWSAYNLQCIINDCEEPDNIDNGMVSKSGHHFNDNVTYECNEGYEISGPTFITCNSSGEWNSSPPECIDIDECARYTAKCHRRADCSNTEGGYTCKCQTGFNDTSGGKGTNCQDIDECKDPGTNYCNENGSQCINFPGGFLCLCDSGWSGDNCRIDIDECNTTGCGVRANCTNFDGGYSCTCESGFPKGDPKIHCYENVIIDLETVVEPFRGDNELIDAKPIHYRFPYFGYEYNSFRSNMNGFFTLGYQPVYENYGPETPQNWKKYSRGQTVIAPFWTDIDSTNINGGLYVHLFEKYTNYERNDSQHRDLSRLGEVFSEYYNLTDFTPRIAIVATWINVTQSSYIVPSRNIKTRNATMQGILISDGIFSYLMFNYDHEQWSFEIHDTFIPSSAGFSQSDKTGFIIATSDDFTKLNNGTNMKEAARQIDGRWIYNVSSRGVLRNAVLRNESECLEFSKNQEIKDWITKKRALSYPCCCSEQQMQLDYSYRVVDSLYDSKITCYEAWFFNNDGVKQTCCYSYGALKKENTGGGFASFENDIYNTSQYFYKCCDKNTDRHLCHLFYEMNPSDDCSRFQPADEPIGT